MADDRKSSPMADSIRNDIHTLDSKITLIAQKMRTIEKNEEIIGRTIVAHNEKLKKFDEMGEGGAASLFGGAKPGVAGAQAEKLAQEAAELRKKVDELAGMVREMRYVLDSVNPLEYVTAEKVKELVRDAMESTGKDDKRFKKTSGGSDDLMEHM